MNFETNDAFIAIAKDNVRNKKQENKIPRKLKIIRKTRYLCT